MKQTKVLILGGTGMLGHVLLRELSRRPELDVHATARGIEGLSGRIFAELMPRIRVGIDVGRFDEVVDVLASVRPAVVINCVGLIKQLPSASDPLAAITINALLPHRIARACGEIEARLIHFSTDCVFDGKKGNYADMDPSNADDLYGRTKALGEVDGAHCVTLRSSIIGHELKTHVGLIEWFLSQAGPVRGYTRAVYSGFPTIEIARIVAEFVLPNSNLHGICNVSSAPISKYELLRIVARRYGKRGAIEPCDGLVVDRSLDSTSFKALTGYVPPSWDELVGRMHADYLAHSENYHAVV